MSTVAGWFKAKDPVAINFIDQILALYSLNLLTDIEVRDYLLAYLPTIVRNSVKWKIKQWMPEHLKSLLSSTNLTADQCQSILYVLADGLLIDTLADLMTHDASDTFISTATTITGTNRYRTLNIAPTITLTADGQPNVILVNKLQNSGTIAKSATGAAGGAPGASGAGAGGAGGGGLIILAKELYNYGTISADGATGANGSQVAASGSGRAGGAGRFAIILGSPGRGGNGGAASKYCVGIGDYNGGGGAGASYIYDGGSGGSCTYTTLTATDLLKAIIDWWLVNVLGKTPTTTKSVPSFYGSGGGGGAAYDSYAASGGGGGGGGELIIFASRILNVGTIQANGGKGGDGGSEGTCDSGGGGGGGGFVYVIYITATETGTITASGGSGGTGDLTGRAGTSGVAILIPVE